MDIIENIKRALQVCDIDIEQCMHQDGEVQCSEWVVMTWDGIEGVQCEKCENYFCRQHGTKTEQRDEWPIKITCLCLNCE